MHLYTRGLAMVLVVLLLMGCQDGRGSAPGAYYRVVIEATLVDRLEIFSETDATVGGSGGENSISGRSPRSSGFSGVGINSGGGGDPRGLLVAVVGVLGVVMVVELGTRLYDGITAPEGQLIKAYDLVLDSATRPSATLHIREGHRLWVPDDLVDVIRHGDYIQAMLLPAGQNRIGITVRLGFSGTDLTIRPVASKRGE